MAENDRANDDARKDAEEMHGKLDKLADSMTKLADAMGSMSKRMDSVEDRMDKHRDDASRDDKHRDDRARKDEEEKKAREDVARRDAQCRDDAKHYSRRDADEKDDSYHKRHDDEEESLRKKLEEEGEAKEVAADRAKRARKDAEEEEEKERREDAKRKDAARDDRHRDDRMRDDRHRDDAHRRDDSNAEIAKIMEEVNRLRAMVAPRADADRAALADAQARADAAYLMFGEQAPPAMAGETVSDYRRRLARGLQKYSNHWKSVDLASQAFADENVFAPVETQIYNDAQVAAKSAVDVAPGTLRVMEKRADGHIIREYVGSPRSWMSQFAGVRQRATGDWKINLGGKH